MSTVLPSDEARHPIGSDLLWSESYYLDFVDEAQGVAGYVRLGLCTGLGRAWYWACLVGPGRPLVTVIDHDVPLPTAPSLEIRTEGLWADLTVESPLDHVSVGVEAFAVGVDDPAEVYGDLRGDRIPFGLDLEWETDGGTYAYPGVSRYEVPCRVHGEVLLADETLSIDGWGQRDHSWGVRDWWAMSHNWSEGALADGTRFHGTHSMPGWGDWSIGYVQAPGGAPEGDLNSYRTEPDFAADGMPTRAHMTFPGLDLEMTAVAHSPVLLVSPAGDISRFPRSMVRYQEADGRTGVGWVEYGLPETEPPPPT